jgi:hypothetical protein
MAIQSYKERMAAARAAASAQRKAERAAWLRQVELMVEVRRLAPDAVKAGIRARGDKVNLYSRAQLVTMANATISDWLVAKARARITQRAAHSVRNVREIRTRSSGQGHEHKEIQR